MKKELLGLSRSDSANLHLGSLVAYFIYGIATVLFFLYLSFPYDQVERLAVEEIAKATTVRLEPEGRRISFPMRVRWDRVKLEGFHGAEASSLQAEQVSLDLAVLQLLKRNVSASVQFRLGGGEISGVAEWTRAKQPAPFHIRGHGRDLNVARFLGGVISAGRVQGDWEYEWDSGEALKGRGFLTVEIEGLVLRASPLLRDSVQTVSFQKASGRIVLKRGVITVEDCRTEGEQIVARCVGSVILQNPIDESLLNITIQFDILKSSQLSEPGWLLMPHGLSGPGLLVVKGTLRRPAYFLNDVPLSILGATALMWKTG